MKHFKLLYCLLLILNSCTLENNYGVRLENDILAKTDKNYTHGTAIVRTAEKERFSEATQTLSGFLPALRLLDTDPVGYQKIKVKTSQEIHTPEDLSRRDLIQDDAPYAGYLSGSIARISEAEDIKLETTLEVGLTGPWSGAQAVQKFVHNTLDMGDKPSGWSHQLKNEPQLNLYHVRSWKKQYSSYLDFPSQFSASLGTVHTDVSYKTGLRAGYGLPDYDSMTGFSIFYFANAGAALIGRNAFYDGNLFRESHSVSARPVVGLIDTGAVVKYSGYSLAFKVTFSTQQFSQQSADYSIFGGLLFGLDW